MKKLLSWIILGTCLVVPASAMADVIILSSWCSGHVVWAEMDGKAISEKVGMNQKDEFTVDFANDAESGDTARVRFVYAKDETAEAPAGSGGILTIKAGRAYRWEILMEAPSGKCEMSIMSRSPMQ